MRISNLDTKRGARINDAEFIAKQQRAHAPPPLPSRRKRALTPPLPPQSRIAALVRTHQKTIHQSHSPFFSELPHDVRRLIYQEVLVPGSNLVHIVKLHKKLGHVRCRWRGKGTGPHDCWGTSTSDGLYRGTLTSTAADGGLLPLLMTCRQVQSSYSEAITILYAHTTFDLAGLDSLLFLSSTILPQRLNTIRSIDLFWDFRYLDSPYSDTARPFDFPHDVATWERAWRVLAGMEGLRELKVMLVDNDWTLDRVTEEKIFQPLRAVTQPTVFEVDVRWPASEGLLLEDVPFRIKRRNLTRENKSHHSPGVLP
ncbi:MAG: hypothetical protein M1833_003384 [Piccolia ochrophora]|nr:MAG: hypothetical protein M1833_003384 [Piccolia ochrophora]